jgi:hypothetical protein
VPTATPSYYPCLRRPPRGWRRLAFECGAIFSVLLYTGDTSGRRCVTALQSYTAKKRIDLLFSSAKKRYTALMYVRRPHVRWLTVFLSEKKKERIAQKRCTGGGVTKRKEKKRSMGNNEARRTRARHCAYQAGRHPTKLSCAFSYGSLLGPFNVGTPPCPLGV